MKIYFIIALAVLIEYAGAQCIDPADPQYENMTYCDTVPCYGDCFPDNGCACNDGLTLCIPNVNTTCPDNTLCCPEGLNYSKDLSCCTPTAICVDGCATDEECNPLGVCQCNKTAYPDLTRDDFHPTVVCENSVMIVTMKECELETLGYDPSTVHLRDPSKSCYFYINDKVNGVKEVSFMVQARSTWCGNTLTYDQFYVNISNTIYIGVLDTDIIRFNNLSFNFTCVYKRDMITSLKLPGNITYQTVYLSGVNETGKYPVTMAAYKDSTFTIPYQNEDEVTIGTMIYVGIFVTGADGKIYVLRIETCVASPTDNRSDVNSVYLIKNGCPQGPVSTTVLQNRNALEAAFSISSFQFQNQANVYLFCGVRLCDNTTETCSGCGASKSYNTATNEVKIGLNLAGNFDFVGSAGKHTAASWALLAGIQLAFVFIKFF